MSEKELEINDSTLRELRRQKEKIEKVVNNLEECETLKLITVKKDGIEEIITFKNIPASSIKEKVVINDAVDSLVMIEVRRAIANVQQVVLTDLINLLQEAIKDSAVKTEE